MAEDKSCREIKHEKFAPGRDDALEKKATKEDKRCGNTTRVTEFVWDEVDTSKPQ
ncbi:MAG: hypothetical protein ACOY4Q_08695 [Bacillota bacterium]